MAAAVPPKNNEPSNAMGPACIDNCTTGANVNDLQVCTYDESHIVSGARYHKHLLSCRKRLEYLEKEEFEAADQEMVQCPYNSSHHVFRSVLKMHIVLCDGYFKHCLRTQVEPPKMRKKYERHMMNTVYADHVKYLTSALTPSIVDTDTDRDTTPKSSSKKKEEYEEIKRWLDRMESVLKEEGSSSSAYSVCE